MERPMMKPSYGGQKGGLNAYKNGGYIKKLSNVLKYYHEEIKKSTYFPNTYVKNWE